MQALKKWSDIVKMGSIQFTSRVVMSSLTRTRCDPQDGVPTELVQQYYTQRSGSAMILTECSSWSPRGHAYPGAGNFYTNQQIQGWKKVIQAVHSKKGKIFLQLFHSGRQTHPKINGGHEVWAPSAIAVRDIIRPLGIPYETPKEMTIQDIKETKQQFKKAVENAKKIGFDGIQIHGANGYIVDQFLKSESNKRNDQYGGSAQNRIRFCLQLIDICTSIFKAEQVGLKISPVSQYGDMYDQNPVQTFSLLLKELDKKKIGFVQIRQSSEFGFSKKGSGSKIFYEKTPPQQIQFVCKTLRPFFSGILIANDSMNSQKGLQFINNGWADMVSFGRLYISNPDLKQRLVANQELNEKWDFSTFFSPLNPKGYSDYPFYQDWKQEKK